MYPKSTKIKITAHMHIYEMNGAENVTMFLETIVYECMCICMCVYA